MSASPLSQFALASCEFNLHTILDGNSRKISFDFYFYFFFRFTSMMLLICVFYTHITASKQTK